ncbi:MAG: vitamin B12 dependent-methionine synthase activation domain-containing protein [Cellulosilyticaceae bacterium]
MIQEDLVVQEVLRYVQMPYEEADDAMKQRIKVYYEQLEKVAKPRYTYELFKVRKEEETIFFENTRLQTTSKGLWKLFEKVDTCYVLATTLGIEADKYIQEAQAKHMGDALFLNACANVMIEQVCDQVEQEMVQQIEEGKYMTMRFSPGYGDVPMSLQDQILAVLQAQKRIGLTLSKSGMLLPMKSVTALIGISSKKENRQKTCKTCMMRGHCAYRKRGDICGH